MPPLPQAPILRQRIQKLEVTLNDFKAKWGLAWYKLISSEMGRDMIAAMKLNGPQTRQVNIPIADVAQFGAIITAQNQGWFDALGVLETQLIVAKEGPADLGEPDYSEAEDQQTRVPKKKASKRK